jgi:hypothetical protein
MANNWLSPRGDGDRSPLPYWERRDLARRNERVERVRDLQMRKNHAVAEVAFDEVCLDQIVGEVVENAMRRGPITAALAERTVARYDRTKEFIALRFAEDLNDT